MKIICKYEISSESVITPKEAILYIDGNLSEKDSKNETENMKRATYLKVEKAPTKRYDEYYKDGKQITSQDLMANNKTAPKQTQSSIYYTARVGKNAGYGVIVASEQIIVTLLRSLLLDPTNFIPPHSALVPP